MKKLLLLISIVATATASAQVSVESATVQEQPKFEDKVKTDNMQNPEYTSRAAQKAERAAIRKERNTIEFNAGLNGSLSHFNTKWQSVNGNTNTITGIVNVLFTHNFTKDKFTIDNKVTGKIGYTGNKIFSSENNLVKSQDEWFISTAPAYKISDQWNFGAIVSLRSQFAIGDDKKSNIFAPAYINASLGFTYVCPKEKFPIKINISPLSMHTIDVLSRSVRSKLFSAKFGIEYDEYLEHKGVLTEEQRNMAYCYGLTPNDGMVRYEGGSSIQIDFDRTFGKKGIFRYRTTLYSFYAWINEIVQQTGENKKLHIDHLAPNVRWEHTIDIKATKYFSTQFYLQMYYNKAQVNSLQTQMVLGVGLSYTFKNK